MGQLNLRRLNSACPPPGLWPPRVIAHRGASATHPENTLAAFDAALAEGCNGLELDLQLSRDGVPVVYHDRTLRKVGGGARAVHQADWVEIARLDTGGWLDRRYAGERVASLDHVLKRYARRTRLLLHLKVRPGDKRAGVHVALADALVERIRKLRLTRRVMVLCFDLDTLELITERVTGIPTVLNLRAPRQMTRSLSEALGRVSALSVDVRTISPRIVAAVHDAAKPMLTYTCNTRGAVRRALAAGADGLMSDRPGWLRRIVEAVVHESELARYDPNPETLHLPISHDSGLPRSVT